MYNMCAALQRHRQFVCMVISRERLPESKLEDVSMLSVWLCQLLNRNSRGLSSVLLMTLAGTEYALTGRTADSIVFIARWGIRTDA